jgi:CO dehydrogenase maturation factor
MTTTIALAGKGGTGKTTIAALLMQRLAELTRGPIMAIDADPAFNLHLALGLPEPLTVGGIREDMNSPAQSGQVGVAITRHDYLKQQIRMAVEEGEKIDLLAMGRPEGQGCYCAANHLLRQVLDELSGAYRFVVMDNEAGMEHISRRTTRDVDALLIVSDPTVRGLRAAAAIADMAREVDVNVKRMLLVINRLEGELPPALAKMVETLGLETGAVIPADPHVNEMDAEGRPLTDLNGASPARRAVAELTDRILDLL